jgi:DNA-binding CsgD family transcriptional regulator
MQQVMIQDEWHRVMDGLNERNQRILALRRDGHTMREIASILNVTERTVQRVMEDVSHRHRQVAVVTASD